MAHLPRVDKDDLPESHRYLFEENDVGELNLFAALANNHHILQSYLRWGTTLWEQSGLTREEVEVVILAVARELGSRYEWHQHVSLARDVGIDEDTILAISDERNDVLTDRQALLVAYTEAFLDREVDQSLHDTMAAEFEPRSVVGVTSLASHYLATAYIIDALGVEPEDEFVGWGLERNE